MGELRQIIAVTALSFRGLAHPHQIHRLSSWLVWPVSWPWCCSTSVDWKRASGFPIGDAGDPGRALLSPRLGAQTERDSSLSRAAVDIIKDAPGIRTAPDGSPMADAEIFTKVQFDQ